MVDQKRSQQRFYSAVETLLTTLAGLYAAATFRSKPRWDVTPSQAFAGDIADK
jgi:hypothetical protein